MTTYCVPDTEILEKYKNDELLSHFLFRTVTAMGAPMGDPDVANIEYTYDERTGNHCWKFTY